MAHPNLTVRTLSPDRWGDLERLFGANGACGGCWCMYWRQKKGERWEDVKGAVNRERFRKLVEGGSAHGLLAYEGDEPVGWVSFDRRTDYAKLNRSPSFRCDDAEEVWSIPCFYIRPKHRRRGVASRLLAAALKALERRGVALAEGYPVREKDNGKLLPPPFAWTGTCRMFERAGFRPVGRRDGGKQRMRIRLRAADAALEARVPAANEVPATPTEEAT